MFQNERYEKIYELVKNRGSVTVQLLEKQLYVSEATIRRDLKVMENRGLIIRVWGGAILPAVSRDIPSFVRLRSNIDKKEKIASIASKLLKNSTTIFFDSSTSCMPLVPYMSELKNVSVITNSLELSHQLVQQTSVAVTLLGGQVYEGYILTGYQAVESVKQYYTDLMFFSCSGISAEAGLTSIEQKVVEVCREMMKHTHTKVLLCDTSKVGKTALLHLADLCTPDYVIMDSVPDDPDLVSLLGERLITAPSQL